MRAFANQQPFDQQEKHRQQKAVLLGQPSHQCPGA